MPEDVRTELSGDKIRIGRFNENDVDAFYEASVESIDAVTTWMGWWKPEYTLQNAEERVGLIIGRWEKSESYGFVIDEPATGDFLGACGVNMINRHNRFGNIWYWVRTGRTGQGIATSAVLLAARFAFEDLGLLRAEITVVPGNAASEGVARKTGAVREGLLRNRVRNPSGQSDAFIFSLIPEDISN